MVMRGEKAGASTALTLLGSFDTDKQTRKGVPGSVKLTAERCSNGIHSHFNTMLGWHRHLKTFIIVHYFALKLLVV
jgi:hypothetical protein